MSLRKLLLVLFVVPLFGGWSIRSTAAAPDLAREQRIRHEIVDAVLYGNPISLQTAGGQEFLGIYLRSTNPLAKGTVIILHGRGLHPNWADVVHPLRVGLSESGWDTLAIQLPVLGGDAKYFDYVEIFDTANPRIEAAIAQARENGASRVVILAHSCGSHMFQHWVRSRGELALESFDAYVGIGMGATDYGQSMREPFVLDWIKTPVLDIYAENDFPAVLRMAPERLKALGRGGNPKSAQRMVADSEHYFVNRGEVLLEVVVAWLDNLRQTDSAPIRNAD